MDTLIQVVAIYLIAAVILSGYLVAICQASNQIGFALIGLALVISVFIYKGLGNNSDIRRVK